MKRTLLSLAIGSFVATAQAAPSVEEMWEIIQQQQAEIERLKQANVQTTAKLEQTEVKIEATAEVVEQASEGTLGKMARWAEKTAIGGYGEHHFNHKKDGSDEVDAHRYVLYVSHQFSDSVRFFSELEVEHGLTGGDTTTKSDPGEVELEQAYIEWDYTDNHRAKLGQFLMPIGLINETHEPETFYGTERNPVEKDIIPATWWETGVMLTGEIAPGLTYDAGIHSGLNMPDAGKVRSGRQKSAKARAEDLAFTGRLKYTGIQGLELAASVQIQQDVTQGAGAGENEATLLEAHARYSNGPLTLTGLWAEWDIDGSNFESAGRDTQEGWYIEASYRLLDNLGIFVRQNEWNNSAGLSSSEESEQLDWGLNYWLHENVVLKADYSDQRHSSGSDSVNFGIGWSF